jgi:hypothetical protein
MPQSQKPAVPAVICPTNPLRLPGSFTISTNCRNPRARK